MDSIIKPVEAGNEIAEHFNLLLVDDDSVDRKHIIKTLQGSRRNRYTITVAKEYDDALVLLEQNQFDVCLVDYYLGGHTGIELLNKITYINENASVIMLTGTDSEDIDDQSLRAGVADFLHKNNLTSKLLDRSIRYATHHKKLSIEYERLAHYDDLTKLINRSLFFDRLTHLINHSCHGKKSNSLLYIDLDHFQNINELYGYSIGDIVLKTVAERLLLSVRSIDTVARIGGDEFGVLLEETASERTHAVAETLMEEMEAPFVIGDLQLNVSVSIGITYFPNEKVTEPNSILEQADQALYHAKKLGRKRYCEYEARFNHLSNEGRELGKNLYKALQNDEIFPHYQPQYSLLSGKIEAFQALARWQPAEQEIIFPPQFIEQAEKLKFMPILTEKIVNKACADLADWSKTRPEIKVAINISASANPDDYLFSLIKKALVDYKIEARQLELEFDASMLVTHPVETMDTLNKLRELGVNITINNFGKGDISLWSLAELTINSIKIDMGLIHGIGVSLSKEIIVKVILDMAKQFSLKVVAVGVETKEQADFLARYGCNNVQGYLYSRSLSSKDAFNLLKK